MPHRERKTRDEMKKAKFSHVAMLSHAALDQFPPTVFSNEEVAAKLVRLDLSFNNITTLPHELFQLTSLKELWLHNNPLQTLPAGAMQHLQSLEVIDIRNTQITELPPEMATLQKLYELDWRDTPLAGILLEQHGIAVNDLPAVMDLLKSQYTRKGLEAQLLEILTGEHFAKEADTPNIGQKIKDLVVLLSSMFDDLNDFKLFVKRSDNLLPEKMADITPESLRRTKDSYFQMQRETHRKRMAADVEIKLRAIYFDRIERKACTEMIDSIYANVMSLEDIQFFVKYAPQIMPPEPDGVTGEIVWQNILALQAELSAKRAGAISSLTGAMLQLYPEQRPEVLAEKAAEVAKVFQVERFATKKELNILAQITAEASKLFPPDYASLEPADILENAQALFRKK